MDKSPFEIEMILTETIYPQVDVIGPLGHKDVNEAFHKQWPADLRQMGIYK